MNRLITVYILAYNRPDYLRECLQSIDSQTLRDFRLVVLDNASKTDLKPIVEQAAQQRGRPIEYVRHPSNIESIGNFRHAWDDPKTTPYFLIFHDDDMMHPEFLERGLAAIQHPSAPAWSGSHSLGFTGRAPCFPALDSALPLQLSAAELAYRLLTGRCNITFSTVIYRSELTSSIDLETLSAEHSIVFDRPLLLALAERHGCALSPLPLVLYRCHPAQDSKNGPLNEDHLLALFTTYRRMLQPLWNPRVERDFYAWSGFHIPDGHGRLAVTQRSPFRHYLQKARDLGVYRDRCLWHYLIGSVRSSLFARLRRAPAKLRYMFGERLVLGR